MFLKPSILNNFFNASERKPIFWKKMVEGIDRGTREKNNSFACCPSGGSLDGFISTHYSPQEKPTTWEVYFSPNGGCTDAITRELDKAQSTVLVQAYSFTSYKIAKALLDAHKRGVRVEVILDKSQKGDQYSSADFLANSGISMKIDSQHAIAHNKVMVIDGKTVITGSFNFTKAAEENNAENLLVIHDRQLAQRYTENWDEHAKHSEVYLGRSK
jgi:phosphatidylserine/phosphatidylglycerophosphate/cardiolipin synthase-like enzyme